jgi:hypothetical protein
MKILKKVRIVVDFDEDDLVALVAFLGSMSKKNYMGFGMSDEQADLLYLIYSELSDYVDDK